MPPSGLVSNRNWLFSITFDSTFPGCCEQGWRITLAGSRFLKDTETRYAAVEGEALAIAWALEHTKFFTQGCDKLLVVTDHKPLIKLFTDRSLDEITNSRLFSIKQRTLPWRFTIQHMAGKDNLFSDATSRNPVESDEEIAPCEVLAGIMVPEPDENLNVSAVNDNEVRAITWEMVKTETGKDQTMQDLCTLIQTSFPQSIQNMPPALTPY